MNSSISILIVCETYDELSFARYETNSQKINFLIGGAYGFSDEIYQRANEKIALSKMTFTHQMVRLFMVEQFYRADQILQGKPYHND